MEKRTEKKVDCSTCKWKRNNPGTRHIRCNHPSLNEISTDPALSLMGILASVGRVAPFMFNSKELNIKANPVGVKRGWFNFPFNFDPTWLENCDGYEKQA